MQSYLLNQVLLSNMDFHMAWLEWALLLKWVEIAIVLFPFLSSSPRQQSGISNETFVRSSCWIHVLCACERQLTSFLMSKSFGLSVPLRSSRSEVDEVPFPCVVLGLWFSYLLQCGKPLSNEYFKCIKIPSQLTLIAGESRVPFAKYQLPCELPMIRCFQVGIDSCQLDLDCQH